MKMKNITKSLLILLSIFAISCETDDVEDRPVAIAVDAPVLAAPGEGSSYVLAIENASTQAERFVWSSANFDENVVINYSIELDKAGNNFAAPQVVATAAGQNQASVTVQTLNTAVLAAGGVPFEAAQFEVRIRASLNNTSEPMYSNVIAISITPYVAVIPALYFVGAPQAYYGKPEWTPGEGIEMRYIGDGTTKIYEAYVKVAPGNGFKFTGGLNWDEGNYGTIGGAQNGNLQNDGGSSDIKVAETDGAGLYYVWVDIDNLTYKYSKMNWGIIGDATPGGWDNETPMTYDFTANKFTITTTLTAAQVKFRASNVGIALFPTENNNAWKFNVGNSDPITAYTPDTPNFSVTAAGTHTVELSIDILGNATVNGL
jgi:hypothetical protein